MSKINSAATVVRSASVETDQSFSTLHAQFEKVLNDPRIREQFREHLSKTLCVETLEFWEETNMYARLSTGKLRRAKLHYLYDQYVSDHADTPINISSEDRLLIEKSLLLEDPPAHLLTSLGCVLFDNMASSQFLNYKYVHQQQQPVNTGRLEHDRLLRKSNTTDAVLDHYDNSKTKIAVHKTLSNDDDYESRRGKHNGIWSRVKQTFYSPQPRRPLNDTSKWNPSSSSPAVEKQQ